MRCIICRSLKHNKRRCPMNFAKRDKGGASSVGATAATSREKLVVSIDVNSFVILYLFV